jgi:hypothetical protein
MVATFMGAVGRGRNWNALIKFTACLRICWSFYNKSQNARTEYQQNFIFSKISRPTAALIQSPIQKNLAFSQEVKWPG